MKSTNIKISGMTCGGCAASVTRALTALPGVAKASVSLEKALAVVEYDPDRVSVETLCQAVGDAGFEAARA